MTDLGPLPACYENFAHRFKLIVPLFKKGDVSLVCNRCGTVRQFPVTSPELPLDALSADEIERRIFGGRVPHG